MPDKRSPSREGPAGASGWSPARPHLVILRGVKPRRDASAGSRRPAVLDHEASSKLAELRDDLERLGPRVELDFVPHLSELRTILRAQNTLLYNPECADGGWDLEFSTWVGADAEKRRASHRKHVQRSPLEAPVFAAYDPFAVQAAQRNRAFTLEHLVTLESNVLERHRSVWTAIDAGEQDQLRVLVCQGPRLLAWFGVVRDEPFARDEEAMLTSLVVPLRARLLARRAAQSAGGEAALLNGLLEALAEPALLLGRHGHVEAANGAGLRLVDDRESGLLESLRDALARGRPHPSFSLTRLQASGCPEYVLALHTANADRRVSQIARAVRSWKVTGARAAVLEKLAAGQSNKEIAHALRCAEVTVERHVTALFRASGTRSRTELLARLFALSGASRGQS